MHESRAGRAAEVAAWANATASLVVGAGVFALFQAWIAALAAAVAVFVLLRVALAHRIAIWISAALGTVSVAAIGGVVSWLFSHMIDRPSVPIIAGVLGAILAGLLPGWSYVSLARRRTDEIPDSLLDAWRVPSSR
ncbi:hypothetical protein AKJ09_08932 [Labilithrix luteola]|uniref:Uncharacterized protein n=1 Tax=Labilithrix luteola TaxID=1391654 RepID=A0A0K1Q961_9BACT|nr:hypothetical protein [Labilithrix luteola]AKV02269.1 hypothetical protein AKJ09_08932 [Labilithrix luteola]